MEINVSTDDTKNQLTIQDFGIGMNQDELIQNLGTIAHSGSKEFIEALKSDGEKNDALIGKFGWVSTAFLWSLKRFKYSQKNGKRKEMDIAGRVMVAAHTISKRQRVKEEVRRLSSI